MGDVVILDSRGTADPFVLEGGAELWRLLARPRGMSDLVAGLGTPETHQPLVESLLAALVEAGAVEAVSG